MVGFPFLGVGQSDGGYRKILVIADLMKMRSITHCVVNSLSAITSERVSEVFRNP